MKQNKSLRMDASLDSNKICNRRNNTKTTFSDEMKKHRQSNKFQNNRAVTAKDSTVRAAYNQYDNGQISREQLFNKLTNELNYTPTAQLKKFISGGESSYGKLLQSLNTQPEAITIGKKMPAFSDKKVTYVDTEPAKHEPKQAKIRQMIGKFQDGNMSSSDLRNNLYQQGIQLDAKTNRLLDQQSSVGVSHRQLTKAILEKVDREQKQLNHTQQEQPKMSLKNIQKQTAIQNYCDNHILIHGKTGAVVGKRANAKIQVKKDTPDLLSWDKRDSYATRKSGKKNLSGYMENNVISPKQDSFMEKKSFTRNTKNASSGDIIGWSYASEPKRVSNEREIAIKSFIFARK